MSREDHSDIKPVKSVASDARYGPGGSATAKRRAELAARAASRSRGVVGGRLRVKRTPFLSAHRRRLILVCLGLTAVGSVAALVLASPLLEVRRVELSGTSGLLPSELEQIRRQIAVPAHSNLVRAPLGSMEKGLRQLAALNHARAAEVAERLTAIPGMRLVNDSFFNEFTLELPVEARPAVHAMVGQGVLGGVSLGRLYPGEASLANGLVVAVTETVSDADIDAFEAALKEVAR